MNFGTTGDVEAPIEFVFGQLSDFNAIERAAMRRGAEVQRTDTLPRTGPGMTWDTSFVLRGKTREVQLELIEFDPPNGMVLASRSPSLSGDIVVELVALSRNATRVRLDVNMMPETLTGKLMVQSLKLARKTLTSRMQDRMAAYAAEIKQRYERSA